MCVQEQLLQRNLWSRGQSEACTELARLWFTRVFIRQPPDPSRPSALLPWSTVLFTSRQMPCGFWPSAYLVWLHPFFMLLQGREQSLVVFWCGPVMPGPATEGLQSGEDRGCADGGWTEHQHCMKWSGRLSTQPWISGESCLRRGRLQEVICLLLGLDDIGRRRKGHFPTLEVPSHFSQMPEVRVGRRGRRRKHFTFLARRHLWHPCPLQVVLCAGGVLCWSLQMRLPQMVCSRSLVVAVGPPRGQVGRHTYT